MLISHAIATTSPNGTAAHIITFEDVRDLIERLGDTLHRYEFANGIDIVAGRLVVDAIASDVVLSICPFSGDAAVLKWKQIVAKKMNES